MEYAIVDIETTGGYASGAGITEIAVYIHNGEKVIDQFETLINPHQYIPLPIQMLTGIDNDMVDGKPTFEEIAATLFNLLDGRIFVAHSVNFDYSFIRHHFEKAGYKFNASKLCTVRMSRKIKPGLTSYSLSKLCASLKIPLYNNHRAGGDAAATTLLFEKLLEWDSEGVIAGMLKKNSKEQLLPPHLPKDDFEVLPSVPGVYYFKNREGKVVYVGKANDLRKRVLSHFTGNNALPQRQHFLRDIHAISFEKCGTELMAFLLEAIEIARLWPVYNRAMKRRIVNFGLYAYEDLNGFMRLAIGKQGNHQLALHEFTTEIEGRNLLHKLVRNFNLCPELCGITDCRHDSMLSDDAENPDCWASYGAIRYNEQVRLALNQVEQYLPSFIIKDKGRHEQEQSCIWVEKGKFYGMGYIDAYSDIHSLEDIKSSLKPYKVNHYMLQLIYNYAEKYPYKVMQIRNEDLAAAQGF
ncbi:DNA polymerase III subunit epsilon [Taibaiella lutea]|uniref:DNA polymerase III subunit epsilon n=1 Tax=Taibaiella lutea TaxID=2608001 RepID=A0A5M6CD01_9BACT|nr:exonuclease domain-containing protein [Taibaiella lutea]KAA5532330.1 DNA polymerase III subunit epsilon [Taibaiella lutea]